MNSITTISEPKRSLGRSEQDRIKMEEDSDVGCEKEMIALLRTQLSDQQENIRNLHSEIDGLQSMMRSVLCRVTAQTSTTTSSNRYLESDRRITNSKRNVETVGITCTDEEMNGLPRKSKVQFKQQIMDEENDNDDDDDMELLLKASDHYQKTNNGSLSDSGSGYTYTASMSGGHNISKSIAKTEPSQRSRRSITWVNNRLRGDISETSIHHLEANRDKHDFTKDIFSFFLVSRLELSHRYIPTAVAWFTFLFQMVTYMLIFGNSTNPNDLDNIFGFPPNLNLSTRIAEIFAIFITVATQEDLRTGLNMFFDGYSSCEFVTNGGNVSFFNWQCSVFTRCLEGFFGPIVTFILIMKSKTVVDLLLNFSAIEFVSMLDETAYGLCEQGFLGSTCKKVAEEIEESFYYPKIGASRTGRRKSSLAAKMKSGWRALFFFLIILLPLLVAWIWIVLEQEKGRYSCKFMYFEFDDSVNMALGAFSGTYLFHRENGASIYKLDIDERIGVAQFEFCDNIHAWTFRYGDHSNPISSDPCDGWSMRSASERSTSPYDILSASSKNWFVRSDGGREINVDGVSFFCVECDKGYCGDNGRCNEDLMLCECNDGWYGSRCGFRDPCGVIAVDTRFDPFRGTHVWSREYVRLMSSKNAEYVDIYDRPVYVSEQKSYEFELVMFTGRRWVVTSSHSFTGLKEKANKEMLIRYLLEDFHPIWSNYEISFISEKISADTSTDMTPSPIQLTWSKADSDRQYFPISTVLLCAECNDDTNPCQSGGKCGDDKRCDCSGNQASGALCHILPIGDGKCDEDFNNENYYYDGGDCCQATCVSDKYKCGQNTYDGTYSGYCSCVDPTQNECPNAEDTCWLKNSESLAGDSNFAESGTALAFSANARVVAVGEPGLDRVKVYSNEGSKWVQLGETLFGEPRSRFGESLTISGNGRTLVVGASEFQMPHLSENSAQYQGRVHIFQLVRNSWHVVDETPTDKSLHEHIKKGRLGGIVEITQDGRTLFMTLPYGSNRGIVVAYERNETSSDYFQSEPILLMGKDSDKDDDDESLSNRLGSSLSISNAGNIVALGGRKDKKKDFVWVHRQELDEDFNSILRPIGSKIQGCCGIISGDGTVIVVSLTDSPKKCRIYYWDTKKADWSRRGAVLDGTALALSTDGLTLAVLRTDEESDISTIHTFFWNGVVWDMQGLVSGSAEASVVFSGGTMSGLDTIMAVGTPLENSEGPTRGLTSIYKLRNNILDSPKQCKSRNSLVRIEITFDAIPNETIWELRESFSKDLIMKDGPFSDDLKYTTKVYETHLPDGVLCGEFTIFDMGGNGNCCTQGLGSFSVYFGDEQIVNGGNFDWSDKIRFGENCKLTCDEGESVFSVAMTPDNYPLETTWELKDEINDQIFMTGRYFLDSKNKELIDEMCLPSTLCANFTVYDSYGDGLCCIYGFGSFSVSWDGKRVATGGEFEKSDMFLIGNDCTPNRSIFDSKVQEFNYTTNFTAAQNDSDLSVPKIDDSTAQFFSNSSTTDVSKFQTIHPINSSTLIASNAYNCGEGYMSLVVHLTTDSYPSETQWLLHAFPIYDPKNYTESNTILESGPYTDQNTEFVEHRCINRCTMFYIFDRGGDGITAPGGYSLFLDGKHIGSGSAFGSETYHLIGDCYHITSSFRMDPGSTVSCPDDLRNACRAPVNCANNGIIVKPAGQTHGEFALRDGDWTISGAYSMGFENKCNVECSGHCAPTSGLSCGDNSTALHLLLSKISYTVAMNYSLTTLNGNLLLKGNVDKNKGFSSMERTCIPTNQACTVLHMNFSKGIAEYAVFSEGKEITSYYALKNTSVYLGKCPPTEPPKVQNTTMVPLKCVGNNETAFRLDIHTDSSPKQTEWDLKSEDGTIISSGGPYNDTFSKVSEAFCVSRGGCKTFTIYDSWGNGFWVNRYYPVGYAIYFGDQKIASGAEFKFSKSVTFGNCTASQNSTKSDNLNTEVDSETDDAT